MKLAIIGGGWAGLAAAVEAADLGCKVSIFESAHTLGGRARRVPMPELGFALDNGQHILLSAYQDTLNLMARLGRPAKKHCLQMPLDLRSLDGSYRLTLANAPEPWHLAGGLLLAKGLDWKDKWQLASALLHLRRRDWRVSPSRIRLDTWLQQHAPSPRLFQHFWQPLCLAAMNTPVHQACAQLFANVLRDSIGHSKAACQVLLPQTDLSDLWPDHVAPGPWKHSDGSVHVRRGHTVRKLDQVPSPQGDHILVDGEPFDGLILSCPPPSVRRLLQTVPPPDPKHSEADLLLASLAAFTFTPIATLTLVLERPWTLPAAMLMLRERRAHGQFGQWLFDWSVFRPDIPHPVLQIVISDAAQASRAGEAAVVEGICQQLQDQHPNGTALPAVIHHKLIIEKRATFTARAGLVRPDTTTPWPAIWLAGDWTDTGYPGVLEGAVRSGQRAARKACSRM